LRILLQRVLHASVEIEKTLFSAIGHGLLCFVGFKKGDTSEVLFKMINRVRGLRVFPDENGKMNLSVEDIGGEILLVSQFTLYANTQKGRRPGFDLCLESEKAQPLFQEFCEMFKNMDLKVKTGVFQADMKISLTNDGPVTILLDTEP